MPLLHHHPKLGEIPSITYYMILCSDAHSHALLDRCTKHSKMPIPNGSIGIETVTTMMRLYDALYMMYFSWQRDGWCFCSYPTTEVLAAFISVTATKAQREWLQFTRLQPTNYSLNIPSVLAGYVAPVKSVILSQLSRTNHTQ